MKIRVIDFETTDTDKAKAAGKPAGIVEYGFSDVCLDEDGRLSHIERPVSGLVNPGLPMSAAARGVHHISPEELEGKPSPDHAASVLMTGMEPGDAFAAHNMGFERAFFGGGSFPWICTYQCARHIFPNFDSHGNQALRYELELDASLREPGMFDPSHRAGPDAYLSAHLLATMLLSRGMQELIRLSATPVLEKTIRFGKHFGKAWAELDSGYLEWIVYKSDLDADTKYQARHHLDMRAKRGIGF